MQPVKMEHGPPAVRHRIRGELRADLPVCGVEIFAHRHAHLSEWSLVDAIASFWRLYWGTSGSAVVLHDGREHPLEAGSGLLIPPHTNYASRCDKPFSKWYIHFTFSGIGNLARPGVYPVAASERLRTILDRTCPATGAPQGTLPPDIWRPLWVAELVTVVVQQAVPDLCMTSDVSPHADAVMQLVRQRAATGLTLSELAGTSGLSVREVSRIVKDVTGFTPARYLLELRLDAAMNLLRHTDQSIESIARESGFPNRHYLTRMLTKHRQTTPAAFRARVRQ